MRYAGTRIRYESDQLRPNCACLGRAGARSRRRRTVARFSPLQALAPRTHAMHPRHRLPNWQAALREDRWKELVRWYRSPEHCARPETGCPVALKAPAADLAALMAEMNINVGGVIR